jgi:hypothetical protein
MSANAPLPIDSADAPTDRAKKEAALAEAIPRALLSRLS